MDAHRAAAICLATAAVIALTPAGRAQDCERLSGGARTDCFIGRSRVLGQDSDIAASSARLRTSAERLRAVTGGSYDPMRPNSHRAGKARSTHKVRRD